MRLQPDRTTFRVRKPNQFDLSDHQLVIMDASTRKLMPTIIRLAELVDPSDYGDLVALLYWLSTINRKSTPAPVLGTFWCLSSQAKFRPEAVATILDYITLQAPLTYLPGLISTVIKQTGTFFLDACPLCGNFLGPEFSFSLENFIWFRDDWQKAKPIHSGNQELIKWSYKSPERLVEISQILRKAHEIHQFYKDDQPAWC